MRETNKISITVFPYSYSYLLHHTTFEWQYKSNKFHIAIYENVHQILNIQKIFETLEVRFLNRASLYLCTATYCNVSSHCSSNKRCSKQQRFNIWKKEQSRLFSYYAWVIRTLYVSSYFNSYLVYILYIIYCLVFIIFQTIYCCHNHLANMKRWN